MSLRKLVLPILLLISAIPAYANLGRKVVFEVRTTGNQNNGGCFDPSVASPGTDYSQQDTAQVAYTDLVIGGTNTQLTSALNPFSSTSPGNCIQITGGTGFTTGTYEVISVTGSTATMDRAVGTAASTGGTGNLGGAKADPLLTLQLGNLTSSIQVWLKAGTYTYTATQTIGGGSGAFLVYGYNTTRGDYGTPPLITTSTNSVNPLISLNAGNPQPLYFANVNFSNTAVTPGAGFTQPSGSSSLVLRKCNVTGFTVGINVGTVSLIRTRITGNTSTGITTGGNLIMVDSSIDNNTSDGLLINGGGTSDYYVISRSLIVKNGGKGINVTYNNSKGFASITDSTISNNTSDGLAFASTGSNFPWKQFNILNSIIYGNGGWGINESASTSAVINMSLYGVAFGGNTSGSTTNVPVGTGTSPIILTGDPSTNAAGGDFSLNSLAGAGALLRGTGYPGVFPISTTTGYADVGPVQHQDTGGGGTVSNFGTAY